MSTPIAALLLTLGVVAQTGSAQPQPSSATAGCDQEQDFSIAASVAELSYDAADVRADLAQLRRVIDATHPDPGRSFDSARLRRLARQIARQLPEVMTVRAAWLEMARLNPLFHDAHTGVRHPVAAFEAYVAAGGAAFPIGVQVDQEGNLRVSAGVAPTTSLDEHDIIVSINGHSTQALLDELMPRMRGETESIQHLVLAFNFPAYIWTLLGPQRAFCLGIESGDGGRRHVLFEGDGVAAHAPAANPQDKFAYSLPARGVALMRVASFDPTLKAAFTRFLHASFARMATDNVHTLLIDIRDNPGGTHDVSDLLASRLTRVKIPVASSLLARITVDNRELAPRAEIGSVVSVPFDEPIEPYAQDSAFDGDVFVLVSRYTYSQAIVFAATLQDAGIARIVGETTGGSANQTGQIVLKPLNHTGLQALAPLYVIYRPNGDHSSDGLRPDLAQPHDPLAPGRMVSSLLEQIAAGD